MSPRRIVVVANDHVGSRMAGPGIRSLNLARELRTEGDVTLVVPFETDLEPDGFDLAVANVGDPAAVGPLVAGADCVVAQRLPVPTMRALARTRTRRIYDLYTPGHFEMLALDSRHGDGPRPTDELRLNFLIERVALQTGDAFVCASETQRDLWLGSLLQLGRVDPEHYERDPSLRDLIDVVPFGIEVEPPRTHGPVLKGVLPGIGPDDRVLLWGGGVWNWLDPLTVIEAVAKLSAARDDVRLVFLGMRRPNPNVPNMRIAEQAIARADELGVRDRAVFFKDGWVPYEQRGAYLLEADLGVSAHFDDVESRFAFRTRLLDYLWAGLPIVTTVGDTLGDLVRSRGLGRGVPVGDVSAWVEALESLLEDEDAYGRAQVAVEAVRDEYAWPRAVEPLRRLVRQDGGAFVPRRRSAAAAGSWAGWRVRHAVASRGVVGATRRLARLAAGSARRRAIR